MRSNNWILISLMLALLGFWGLQGSQAWAGRETEDLASVENMAFPLPDKPSFAVVPFDNIDGDTKLEYLSDGVTS